MKNDLMLPHPAITRLALSASLLAIFLLSGQAFAQQDVYDIIEVSKRMVSLEQAGRHADAIPWAQRALVMSEEALGPVHPTVAIYVDHLAVLYHRVGEVVKAEPLFQRALAIQEQVMGPFHLRVAITLEHYSRLLRSTHRTGEAARLEARAKSIRSQALLAR